MHIIIGGNIINDKWLVIYYGDYFGHNVRCIILLW